ncbi:MAG: HAMP domain-containing sensor histidine kinase [Trebonia sp.]
MLLRILGFAACYPPTRRTTTVMSRSDQRKVQTARPVGDERRSAAQTRDGDLDAELSGRPLPMLWRVFAANAAVFAVAFALLTLAPVTIHESIRLDELVLLLVGLVVMLLVDLLLLRQALTPLARLTRVMARVDLLRPGQRAIGLERSSSEVLGLAGAFNEMLERLEQERRESSARALAAQEQERLRIARELHDEIGQTLTAVALRAEHASARSDADGAELAALAAIVQQTLQDVRRISRELRPEALDELGLVNALIALCSRVTEQSGVHVQRRLEGAPSALPADLELAVYRIAQEALTNAIRHSGAAEIAVSLSRDGDELVLTVGDSGCGLPEAVVEGGGLRGMRERAMLIGGHLQIDSSHGAGTTVTLRVPLAAGDA